jgi:hypothetical protein
VERKMMGNFFGKREMWKRNSKIIFWEKKKQVREILKK